MLHNFAIADITFEKKFVYFFDERSQGKGADAPYSPRIRCHLRKIREYQRNNGEPRLCMSLLDNCCGQNKAQVVMQSMGLLSIVFYKVGLMYFLPGLSHMLPDRVVGYCERTIAGYNIYKPSKIVEFCSKIHGVFPEYLQGISSRGRQPFRVN